MKQQISSGAVVPVIIGLFITVMGFSPLSAYAQCKTFRLSDKGDTLNCVDFKGKKQGKWIIKEPAVRGNPGFEEEGVFVNDLKEGVWKKFTEQGDVDAVETYRWGLLDGKSLYYSLQGLEREENWRAIDPAKLYDTLDVPDLYDPAITRQVVVKNDGISLKHGKFIWFDAATGYEVKREDYFRDSAINSLATFGLKKGDGKNASDTTGTAKKKEKPPTVLEWEKKNSGKKKVVVRDGAAGY
jgi:hypothetical protein